MGRFGLKFSEDSNPAFRIVKKPHYSTIIHDDCEQQVDGPFQRGLCWTSYFVMVFVSLCVFNQNANAGVVAGAAGFVAEMPAAAGTVTSKGNHAMAGWTLRPSL